MIIVEIFIHENIIIKYIEDVNTAKNIIMKCFQ